MARSLPRITPTAIISWSIFRSSPKAMSTRLESLIDDLNAVGRTAPQLHNPRRVSAGSAAIDVARTQTRAAERRVIELRNEGMLPNTQIMIYLNRLSDLLFMLARYEDRRLPMEIVTGQPPEPDTRHSRAPYRHSRESGNPGEGASHGNPDSQAE